MLITFARPLLDLVRQSAVATAIAVLEWFERKKNVTSKYRRVST
jgi:hypothetical protein